MLLYSTIYFAEILLACVANITLWGINEHVLSQIKKCFQYVLQSKNGTKTTHMTKRKTLTR